MGPVGPWGTAGLLPRQVFRLTQPRGFYHPGLLEVDYGYRDAVTRLDALQAQGG